MRRIAAVLCVLAACTPSHPTGSPSSPTPSPSPSPRPTATYRTIVVLVLENKGYSQIVGSHDAPYLNSLADRYGLATNSYAIAHPSLPNYIAMAYGDTFGISSDCTSCSARPPSVGDQLDDKRIPWKAFFEGLPAPCFGGAFWGDYAKKHNPFAYFVRDAARCRRHMVPLSYLDVHALPAFSFIVPNLCHDMHDCSIASGDRWLSGFLPAIIEELPHDGVLVVTFDEDNGAEHNHIPTILVSPAIPGPERNGEPFTHYSLLRAVEDAYGLTLLRHANGAANLFTAFGL